MNIFFFDFSKFEINHSFIFQKNFFTKKFHAIFHK